MSRYRGETFSIPLEAGGFCHNKNIDTIAPEDMVHPSRNIWLNEGGVRKRGGTTPVDTNVMFTIPAPTFNGNGLDDLSSGTVFTHTKAVTFVVKLHATGTPDTFKWMRTGGAWGDAISITGSEQTLEYGFKVTFAATTGHTANDQWSITITAPDVMGFFDHILANGNSAIVRATSDGKLWKSTAATIATGLGTSKYTFFEQWGDYLLITNGNHIPMHWNGVAASTTNFANVPNDWTGTNYPKQIILHGRLNSMRGWAIGCPLNPKNIYVSANDDPSDFTQATVLVFQIETGDGSGITAGIEYGDRLLLFSKTRPFVFNDNDTNTNNWGYNAGQWEGGVAHNNLLVRTPNDLIAMMENGEIYSVTTAQEYGDYKAASLSRPSFIHEWVKEYINLSQISKFHAIYDPVLRAVKIFVVRTGSSEVDTCLCYFIDRPPSKAWVILDNQDYESGYSAVSSGLVRQSAGIWKLYTGSYNGKIWQLGEANRNDNGNPFQSRYKTPDMGFGNVREHKRYDRTKLVAVRAGTCKATISWWVDGQLKGSETIDFLVGGTPLGEFILGEDSLGGTNILEESVTLGCLGKRLQLEIKNTTANESFFFSQILIDFIPLGKRI